MFLSKSFQILDPKYEIDFLEISFIKIGSIELFKDLLVLTTGEEFKVYIYQTYIKEIVKKFLKL